MKRVLFKVVIPVALITLWMITCYPVCNKAEGFDFFLYWILVGCPFGIFKMCVFLVPRNFGVGGAIGVLAVNCIVGGLIGGIVLIIKVVGIVIEVIKIVTGHYETQFPKVE